MKKACVQNIVSGAVIGTRVCRITKGKGITKFKEARPHTRVHAAFVESRQGRVEERLQSIGANIGSYCREYDKAALLQGPRRVDAEIGKLGGRLDEGLYDAVEDVVGDIAALYNGQVGA